MAKRVIFGEQVIRLVAKAIDERAIDRMHKIAMRAHARLVISTPVDLGQARAGWNFSLNSIDRTIPDKPPRGASIPAPDTPSSPKAKSSNDVYNISNLVEHIVYLNEGHSAQAPDGFVEREVAAAVRDVSV